MSSFELPDLYMPYPARLNPNVESTRVHTRAWAIEMGMVDGDAGTFCWDARDFDKHEFALLCGYTHPDLPPSELDLMSDWYVWLFFFDDYFLEAFKKTNDVAGGKRFLARLWDYLPLEPGSVAPPSTNPVERGMAELWTRTQVGSTDAWRRRFVAHTKDTLETVEWEHYNIRHARVANPLEYVAMRRMVGGCVWAACLLERANALRIPDDVLASRPVRLIHEAFADSEHLHNDLMSYSREVGRESENANGVLVFEHFLDLDPQAAANLSSDVLSARLHQLEHTVLTELPLFFEERGLPPQQRVDVLRYANGVMQWISGAYEWHFHSSRYDLRRPDTLPGMYGRPDYIGPTGVGTAASTALRALGFRTQLSRRSGSAHALELPGLPTSGRHRLPELAAPFAARQNPGLGQARVHTCGWAREMGMFDGSVWTEDRFTREDIGGRAGHLLPDANPQQLALASDWTAWSLFVNDYALELFKRRRDLLGAKAFAGRLASFVGEGSITGTPINPAERALADLWRRTAAVSSVELRRSLAARVQDYVASTAWEIFNALQDRTPDPIDYCEMRRITGRGLLALSFVQLPGEIPLPAGVVRDRMIGQLCAGFCDVMPLRNDILSYAKEVRTEGEIINGVTVMQRFFDCDPTRAMAILAALVDSRLAQFQHIVAHHLPELFADLELDEPTRANVRRWVGRLEDWIAGDLEWSRRTPRYDQDPRATAPISAASAFVRGPTGLGTSAARVPELLRRPVPEPGVDVPVTIVPNGNTLDDKLRELARRATLGR